MKSKVFVNLLVALFALSAAQAALADTAREAVPGRLPTHLTDGELQREAYDQKLYPNFMKFLKGVDVTKGLQPADPRNAKILKTSTVFTPTEEMWDGFFKAAAADHLTMLRAFALLAREIKKDGVVVWGPGKTFEKAVADNHIDLGLALPAHNVGTAVWSPDPNIKDPEFMLHLKVFYTEPYVHKFPDNILPANLKIGYGDEETYWLDGKEYKQHTVDTDIYYGPTKGVGFRNVKGIGGQKRGVLGFFQKVLFFLPDAVDSMTIDEKKDAMVTEALVNTTVENFEKDPKYAVKILAPGQQSAQAQAQAQ